MKNVVRASWIQNTFIASNMDGWTKEIFNYSHTCWGFTGCLITTILRMWSNFPYFQHLMWLPSLDLNMDLDLILIFPFTFSLVDVLSRETFKAINDEVDLLRLCELYILTMKLLLLYWPTTCNRSSWCICIPFPINIISSSTTLRVSRGKTSTMEKVNENIKIKSRSISNSRHGKNIKCWKYVKSGHVRKGCCSKVTGESSASEAVTQYF